jgi:hypothetical protein
MTANVRSLTAYTLFCDDIRQELGGKLSAMGIYQGYIGIDANEVIFPKLVAWTVLQMPYLWVGSQAQVQLWDRDRLLIEAQLNFEAPPGPPSDEAKSDAAHSTINIPVEMVPFKAQVGMELRVTFTASDLSYVSDVIRVVRPSAAATTREK